MICFFKFKIQGFSLLELLIVLAIVAILAGISFPAYQSHLIKARRTDGQVALFHLATAMEKYAVDNHGYQGADLQKLKINPESSQKYYELHIIKAEEMDFLISAEPINTQTKDNACGTLAMNDKSEKGILSGNQLVVDKSCW